MSEQRHEPADHVATVEELVRSQLAKALGGGRGILESAVPTVAFTVTWIVTNELRTSLVVSIALTVLLLLVRLAQRSTPQFVLNALVGIGIALGLARGIYTLVQATAVTDRWGTLAYGRLNAILTAPALAAAAAAPFLGATLATVLGSYGDAFLVLAGLGLVAAALMVGATPAAPDGARHRRLST